MKELQQKLQNQIDKFAPQTLFKVDIDRDEVFKIYLESFSEDQRQYYNCNCCKSFLRQYGGIVSIKDGKVESLWDVDPTEEYENAVINLRKYVKSLNVVGPFFADHQKCGVEKNLDSKRQIVWDHFFFKMPRAHVLQDSGSMESNIVSSKDVFKRSLEELSEDSVNTVLEIIGQNSLYRGNEYKQMLSDFQKFQKKYKKIAAPLKDNFCWEHSVKNPAISRIRNSAIGTLLIDLTGGMGLDDAVTRFEKVVAPANYKRPKALVTPRMVEDAKKKITELGLEGSLYRRQLSERDLNVNNTIFVSRSNKALLGDVFDEIKEDSVVNPKSLSKVEEVSIEKFIKDIVPNCKSIRALVENSHLNNFATLVGPKEQDDKSMFKWGNNFSWSYTGGVADSIKERVKKAGGNVTGKLRVSLSWSNHDDLDLHVKSRKGGHIYFGNRTGHCGGELDVDMNAGWGSTREPVENIFWRQDPIEGKYSVYVDNYNKRETNSQGFEVEIDYDGESQVFSFDKNSIKNKKIFEFEYSKKAGLNVIGESTLSKYSTKEKWGIKTGRFQNVKAITLSPNHWGDSKIGNKHYFFFLDKCENDEKIRPFYNEFLNQELNDSRKVFEVLGSKIEVEAASSELSGLGFSDTLRNHLFVEVEGSFKRILKVTF